ncbi:hypothetical protein M405DRAFT_616414 [Rhizopogon salebrosus TDB-379]|nr:hypothetical protein M405DRAFT_616414 [Rhizopogon salebrosus TDB-379]
MKRPRPTLRCSGPSASQQLERRTIFLDPFEPTYHAGVPVNISVLIHTMDEIELHSPSIFPTARLLTMLRLIVRTLVLAAFLTCHDEHYQPGHDGAQHRDESHDENARYGPYEHGTNGHGHADAAGGPIDAR